MFELDTKIDNREATISIVGLGYVGLPLALTFAKKGFNVIGFDINEEKVKQLNECNDITGENENDEIRKMVESKLFITSDQSKLGTDFIIICVPTPTDKNNMPDLSPIESSSLIVGNNMKRNSVIILESTVYPGVTEEIMKPILERESGFRCGENFSLAYSPERINPGDRKHTLENTVKVVGGYNKETTELVSRLYASIIKAGIHNVDNIKTAEAVKIVENVQRAVNISLVNELAIIFEKIGINTLDVLNAARTKWNFHYYYPNAGVGGHCISVDPYYLIEKSKEFGFEPKIISSSMAINEYMPRHIASVVLDYFRNKEEKRVMLLGLTYKENVSDIRNSSSEKIARELSRNNVKVFGYDPFLGNEIVQKMGITPISPEDAKDMGCFLFLVAHDKLKTISYNDFKRMASENAIIFDVKGVLDKEETEKNGLNYKTL